jgi:hypothetical protein
VVGGEQHGENEAEGVTHCNCLNLGGGEGDEGRERGVEEAKEEMRMKRKGGRAGSRR